MHTHVCVCVCGGVYMYNTSPLCVCKSQQIERDLGPDISHGKRYCKTLFTNSNPSCIEDFFDENFLSV